MSIHRDGNEIAFRTTCIHNRLSNSTSQNPFFLPTSTLVERLVVRHESNCCHINKSMIHIVICMNSHESRHWYFEWFCAIWRYIYTHLHSLLSTERRWVSQLTDAPNRMSVARCNCDGVSRVRFRRIVSECMSHVCCRCVCVLCLCVWQRKQSDARKHCGQSHRQQQ